MQKLFFLIVLSALMSCEKAIMPKSASADPVTVFDDLWNTLDKGYSYFDYKGVNWDSVYRVYRPAVHAEMTERELFDLCVSMLNLLRDGHINLRSGFARSYYNYYADDPANFDRELLERNYWRGFEITGPLLHTIIDSVGYIYYRSFANPFSDEQLDVVLQRFHDNAVKGVVIDVRNNEGGNPANSNRILSRIIAERTLLYRTKYKDGPAHDAFTELQDSWLEPDTRLDFPGKIVVLANRVCYSACNFFIGGAKSTGRVTIIGDITGGGGGQPVGHELPNGWAVNFSGSASYLPDGFNIEHGIPPHIIVKMDPADELRGIDTILEYALDFIKN